jgi:hypothetical protein
MEFSPEVVAVRHAAGAGSQIRFVGLPPWHPDTATPSNSMAAGALQRSLGIGTVDGMWDHLVESHCGTSTDAEMRHSIDMFFDATGDDEPNAGDRYLVSWVRAAVQYAGGGPVIVVCAGDRRPAILTLLSEPGDPDPSWPEPPTPPADSETGVHLVPYTLGRVTSPAPWWYQQLWTHGAVDAIENAFSAIVTGLRLQEHPLSTTDFRNFRLQAQGLARLRGRVVPNRVDLLDAAAGTLIAESIPLELPWNTDSRAPAKELDHPVVAALLTILQGNTSGHLHPGAPLPGLVHHVDIVLELLELRPGAVRLKLLETLDRERSRALHQLRVLDIPGFVQNDGPVVQVSTTQEHWTITETGARRSALAEAAAFGPTLPEAAGAVLRERFRAAHTSIDTIAMTLSDAVCSGLDAALQVSALTGIRAVGESVDIGAMGNLLALALNLWRHDDVHGTKRSTLLGRVIDAVAIRIVTVGSTLHANGSQDPGCIDAIAAVADAYQHAGPVLTEEHLPTLAALASDRSAPVGLRGAALGSCWRAETFDLTTDAVRSIAPEQIGDWLFGLVTVARETFLDSESGSLVLAVVDELVSDFSDAEFASALPSLREAFEHFPPREREVIARRLTQADRSGASTVSASSIGTALDARVTSMLEQIGLR